VGAAAEVQDAPFAGYVIVRAKDIVKNGFHSAAERSGDPPVLAHGVHEPAQARGRTAQGNDTGSGGDIRFRHGAGGIPEQGLLLLVQSVNDQHVDFAASNRNARFHRAPFVPANDAGQRGQKKDEKRLLLISVSFFRLRTARSVTPRSLDKSGDGISRHLLEGLRRNGCIRSASRRYATAGCRFMI
jgi:hypothetical protein